MHPEKVQYNQINQVITLESSLITPVLGFTCASTFSVSVLDQQEESDPVLVSWKGLLWYWWNGMRERK
jgi:hypothetical protein